MSHAPPASMPKVYFVAFRAMLMNNGAAEM
jgi:hypothetical protein